MQTQYYREKRSATKGLAENEKNRSKNKKIEVLTICLSTNQRWPMPQQHDSSVSRTQQIIDVQA